MTALLTATLIMLAPPAESPKPSAEDLAQVEKLAGCEALGKCTAAQALIKRGQAAVPALLTGLEHEQELVRFWVCGVLSEIQPKAAYEALLERFRKDPKLRVRNAALYALGSLKDKRAIAPLTVAMGHKDPNVRIAAMMGLSMLADPSTVAVIIKAIRDRDEEVRAMALIALGEMRAQSAYDEMTLRLKEDLKASVRAAACVGLVGLGDVRAVAPMSEVVKQDKNLQARAECAASLGRLGDPSAIPALKSVIAEPDPLGGAAKWAIAEIKKAQAKRKGQ